MTQHDHRTAVDPDKLMAFVFSAVEEAGAALNGALVVMGDRLGYYRSLAEHGPSTPAELAERTDTDQHYAREWLNAQAAGSFVTYDPSTGRYQLPPEHAVALTDETSPAFVGGLFQIAHGTVVRRDQNRGRGAHRRRGGLAATTTPTCMWGVNGSSRRPTTHTWSPTGCPRSTESSTSSPPAPRSPMSAAVMAPRRS